MLAAADEVSFVRDLISALQSQPSAPNTFTDALTWQVSAE